jgi:hypothetical protein
VCPGCGRGVFVLPRSPFEAAVPAARAPATPWRSWRVPVIAAAGCVVVVLASFLAVWPYLGREGKHGPIAAEERNAPRDPSAVVEEARRALAQGQFRVALELLDEALSLRAKGREVTQLHRQADLLARLSPRSLEEVARHAMLVRDPREWEKQFADYHGRAVLFDDAVRRDAAGEPVLAHHVVEAGDAQVRVALSDLEILRDLPLDDGPRLIFGAKLARCGREEGGGWVVRFLPDSGVLMTDLAAVEACYPTPLDEGVKPTLERQARWLDERDGTPAVPHKEK